MSSLVKKALEDALSGIIETDFNVNVDLFASGNDIELNDLKIRKDCIPTYYPIKLVYGTIAKIVIKLELFKLKTKPVKVYIHDVVAVAEVKHQVDIKRSDLFHYLALTKDKLRNEFLAILKEKLLNLKRGERPKMLKNPLKDVNIPAFVEKVLQNIQDKESYLLSVTYLVTVVNVHFRIEESLPDAFDRCNAIGFALQALHLFTPEGSMSNNQQVTKCLELSSLGCYVDAYAPKFNVNSACFSKYVSEQQHIWLVRPCTVKISAVLKEYLPRKRAKRYAPGIICRVKVGDMEVALNSTYLKALMSILDKCQIYENVLLSRVRKLESANALELRSEQEYEALLKAYHVLLLMKDRKKNLADLVKAETQLSMTDLKKLWAAMLDEADTLDEDEAQPSELRKLLNELQGSQAENIGVADEVLFEDMSFEPCIDVLVSFNHIYTYLVLGSKAQHVLKCTIHGLGVRIQNSPESDSVASSIEESAESSHVRMSVMEARAVRGKGYAYAVVRQGDVVFMTSYQRRDRASSIVFNEAVVLKAGEAFVVELYHRYEFKKDQCIGRSEAIAHSSAVQSPFWVQCFSGEAISGELLIAIEFTGPVMVESEETPGETHEELRLALDMDEILIYDEHDVEHIQIHKLKLEGSTWQRQVLARMLGGKSNVRLSTNLTVEAVKGLLSRAHIEYMIRAYNEVVGLSAHEEEPLTKEYRALSFERTSSDLLKNFHLVQSCPVDADVKVLIRHVSMDAAQSPGSVSIGTLELKRMNIDFRLKEKLSLFMAVDWFGCKIKDKTVYPLSRQGDRTGCDKTKEGNDEDDGEQEDGLPRNPMFTAQIELPFMFAYHWNVSDRAWGNIPEQVTSCMEVKVVVKDVYAEFPACLEVMSPMICGLHPLVELIEIEIPTLALRKVNFSLDIFNLIVVGSPVLYPQAGSAAIVTEISGVFEGVVDCVNESDVEKWRFQVDFQSAVGSLSNCCREWRKRHSLVFPCEFLLTYGYSCSRADSALVTITSNKASTLSTSLWVKDLALCYAVNTANRIYLKQFVETAEELTKSTTRRYSSSRVTRFTQASDGFVLPFFSQQHYVRIPYKFSKDTKKFELGFEGYEQHFRFVLGVGDFPLMDLTLDASAKLMKEDEAVGFECTLQGTYFNSKKHVWEPLIEPWTVQGLMQLVNFELGAEQSRVESIVVRSHQILDIDISRQFVQQFTDMVVDVCGVMASLDQLDGSRRLFDVEVPDQFIAPTQLGAQEIGIVNLSGIALTVESQLLSNGDVAHLDVDDNQTAVVVEFESDTVQCECLVDITKVGEFFVRIKSNSSADLGSLGFTISTRDGKQRLIKFHSMLQIQNLTQVDITVAINDGPVLEGSPARNWTISPASTFQVPITNTLTLSKKFVHFRPAASASHPSCYSGYHVSVQKAEGLQAEASTFVSIVYGTSRARTSIKPRSHAPVWNEKRYVQTPEEGAEDIMLELWAYRNAHSDVLLGCGSLTPSTVQNNETVVVDVVNLEEGFGKVATLHVSLEKADTGEEGFTSLDLSALPADGEVLRLCYGCFACALCCEFKDVQDSEEMIEMMIRKSLAENEIVPLWVRQCVDAVESCRSGKETKNDVPFATRMCVFKLKPLLVVENLLCEKLWLQTPDGSEYVVESGAQVTLIERPIYAMQARTADTDWSTEMDLREVIRKRTEPKPSALADLYLPQTMSKTAWQAALSSVPKAAFYLCLCVVNVKNVEKSSPLYKNRFVVARLGNDTRRTSIKTSNLWGEYLNYAVPEEGNLCVRLSCVGDSWRGYYLIGSNTLRLSSAKTFWECYPNDCREIKVPLKSEGEVKATMTVRVRVIQVERPEEEVPDGQESTASKDTIEAISQESTTTLTEGSSERTSSSSSESEGLLSLHADDTEAPFDQELPKIGSSSSICQDGSFAETEGFTHEKDRLRDYEKVETLMEKACEYGVPLVVSVEQVVNAHGSAAGYHLALFCKYQVLNQTEYDLGINFVDYPMKLSTLMGAGESSCLLPGRLVKDRVFLSMLPHNRPRASSLYSPGPKKHQSVEFRYRYKSSSGRNIAETLRFGMEVAPMVPPYSRTTEIRLFHAVTMENTSDSVVQVRCVLPTNKPRSHSSHETVTLLCDDLTGRVPLVTSAEAFQLRLAEAEKSDPQPGERSSSQRYVPISMWSQPIPIPVTEAPLSMIDQDGKEVKLLRVRSTTTNGVTILSFSNDLPPLFILSNRTSRTLVIRQQNTKDLDHADLILPPLTTSKFGWVRLRGKRKVEVCMQIDEGFKRNRHLEDELTAVFDIETEVGRLESSSIIEAGIELHCTVQLMTSSRQVFFDDEGTTDEAEKVFENSDKQYVVWVRVFEVKNIRKPFGSKLVGAGANTRVTVNSTTLETGQSVRMDDVSDSMYWVGKSLLFTCTEQPESIDFKLLHDVQSLNTTMEYQFGEYTLELGKEELPFGVKEKVHNGWVEMHSKSGANPLLKFQVYIRKNALQAMQQATLCFRFAGFGLSIIGKGREEAYLQVRGVDLYLRHIENEMHCALSVGFCQVLNQAPPVRDRIVLSPTVHDIDTLQVYLLVKTFNHRLIHLERLEIVLQELVCRLEDSFLTGVFSVFEALISNARLIQQRFQQANVAIKNNAVNLYEDVKIAKVALYRPQLKLYIENLRIYGIKMTLSFFFRGTRRDYFTNRPTSLWEGALAGLGKWSDVTFRFAAIGLQNEFGVLREVLFRKLLIPYLSKGLRQTWKGLAALDIIGNPQHFVERISRSLVSFSTVPPVTLQHNDVSVAARELRDSLTHVVVTLVASCLELVARITGSIATILEGTRPVRHVALPFRYLTYALQATQYFVEQCDPKQAVLELVRKPRRFTNRGVYEVYHYPSTEKRHADDDTMPQKIREGLSAEAIEANKSTEFRVNHAFHCCLMFVPVLNIPWLFIWILHCLGVLEWI